MFINKNLKKLFFAVVFLFGIQSVFVHAAKKVDLDPAMCPLTATNMNTIIATNDINKIKTFMLRNNDGSNKDEKIKTAGDLRTESGRTALHVAACLGCSERVIEFLVDEVFKTKDIFDTPDNNKRTAFELALESNNVDLAKFIIGIGYKKYGMKAKFDAINGFNALHIIALYNFIDLIKMLTLNEKIVNCPNFSCEYTPLKCAVTGKAAKMVRFLIDKGAKIPELLDPKTSNTLLHEAIEFGDAAVVEELCANGFCAAIINFYNVNGDLPLDLAVQLPKNKSRIEIIKTLLGYGAKSDDKGKDSNDVLCSSPLHKVVSTDDDLEILNMMLLYEPNINVRDKDNNTPLHLAVINQCLNVVTVLLKKNPNLSHRNNQKKTALDLAYDICKKNPNNEVAQKIFNLISNSQGVVPVRNLFTFMKKKHIKIDLSSDNNNRIKVFFNDEANKTEKIDQETNDPKEDLNKTKKINQEVKDTEEDLNKTKKNNQKANGTENNTKKNNKIGTFWPNIPRIINNLATAYLGSVIGSLSSEKQIPKTQFLFASSAFLITHLFDFSTKDKSITYARYCKNILPEKGLICGASAFVKWGIDTIFRTSKKI